MMNNKKNMQNANNEGFAVLAQQEALSEIMAEDCQGLEFSFDRVKLPAGGGTTQEQAHALPPARRGNVPVDAFLARRFVEILHAVREESAFKGKEIERRRYENHAEKGRQCLRHRLFPSRVHF